MEMPAENPYESLLHAAPLLCNGTEFHAHRTGTWKGHFIPGVVFLVWGLWWALRAFRTFHKSRLAGHPYQSRAWWSGRYHIEPILKMLGPPIGVLIELWLDHDQLVTLHCSDGRLSLGNMHNYQHAAAYPAFIVSGFVDMLGLRWELPEGTEKAFLSLAFGVEAFLMSVHKKHDALDQSVHSLLALTMWACAGSILLEMARPRSVLASAARSLSCIMQGMWMIQIGHILYSGIMPWLVYDGTAGAMLAPVIFAMLVLLGAVFLLTIFVATQVWTNRHPALHQALPFDDYAADHNTFEAEPGHNDDSAHEDSGSEGEAGMAHSTGPHSTARKLASAFQVLMPGQGPRHSKGVHSI